jgi:hypothetical protein
MYCPLTAIRCFSQTWPSQAFSTFKNYVASWIPPSYSTPYSLNASAKGTKNAANRIILKVPREKAHLLTSNIYRLTQGNWTLDCVRTVWQARGGDTWSDRNYLSTSQNTPGSYQSFIQIWFSLSWSMKTA